MISYRRIKLNETMNKYYFRAQYLIMVSRGPLMVAHKCTLERLANEGCRAHHHESGSGRKHGYVGVESERVRERANKRERDHAPRPHGELRGAGRRNANKIELDRGWRWKH